MSAKEKLQYTSIKLNIPQNSSYSILETNFNKPHEGQNFVS